jgi:hypothetical protein
MPAETIVYPGHRYSPASHASMEAIVDNNYVFRPKSAQEWLQMFGG